MTTGSGRNAAEKLARLRVEGGFFRVRDVCRFAVKGRDRLRYLNGQVSNDLRKLKTGEAMQACVLSAKGKLDAVIFVWEGAEEFIVEADGALADGLGARLDRYIVADDVAIEPLPIEPRLHLFGPAAETFDAAHAEAVRISRIGAPGIDFSASLDVVPGELQEADDELKLLLRIERRLPAWGSELSADTLPAEAGLDATSVDFSKGCYIGQEVVSRIKSVGHANRTLETAIAAAGQSLRSGMELFALDGPDRAIGRITSAAHHFELSKDVALCYVRRGVAHGADLIARDAGQTTDVTLCPLPVS
jgi:folate-binding protein YgfZ